MFNIKITKKESVLKKFEKERVDISHIYGDISKGSTLWSSKKNLVLSGVGYADFDDQGCCILCFMSDTGESYIQEPICK